MNNKENIRSSSVSIEAELDDFFGMTQIEMINRTLSESVDIQNNVNTHQPNAAVEIVNIEKPL